MDRPGLASSAWVFVVALGCGGGGDDSTGQTVGETGGSVSSSSTGSGSEASTVADASSSMSTTITTSSEGSTTTGSSSTTDTADGSSGDTEGAPCGDALCEPNELCIHPCCGGAAPACYPANQDGSCNPGDETVDPGQCMFGGCDQAPCCQVGPCMPAPPFCMDAAGLSCNGDECNLADCFGQMEGIDLFCTCA